MENNQTKSIEIEDVLFQIESLENYYPEFEESTIYEILVEELDFEWDSSEEQIISEIYDNKEKSIEEIKSIIRDFKIQKLIKEVKINKQQ